MLSPFQRDNSVSRIILFITDKYFNYIFYITDLWYLCLHTFMIDHKFFKERSLLVTPNIIFMAEFPINEKTSGAG